MSERHSSVKEESNCGVVNSKMSNENFSITPPKMSEEQAQELLRSLLHKQGKWVDWGKTCQQLYQAGYSPQTIFEETGFQASQQNLIIVATQVYESLVKEGASADILDYFQGPRSDILYEFRILNQQQRKSVAELAYHKRLELDEAKELAKAFQLFTRLPQLPPNFTSHPGDAIAYQAWKQARQKKDLQARSRLIAKGLKFAHSQTAREAIEKLLSDFTVVASRPAPLLPVYRLEEDEQLSRIIPYIGRFPLEAKVIKTVAPIVAEDPFQVVTYSGNGALVPLPGWQAILKAIDPLAILVNSQELPTWQDKREDVLVVVDRGMKEWHPNNYFLVNQNNNLSFQWFEEKPELPLLGQIILVLKPKKILDENNLREPWQMDD